LRSRVSREPISASRITLRLPSGRLVLSRHGKILDAASALYSTMTKASPAFCASCSARAMAEALPYLHKATQAAAVVVDDEPPTETQAVLGSDAANHLKHHGIDVVLHRARMRDNDVGMTLIAEARRLEADLIVMGAYGHSRVREWLLGGTTDTVLHKAPIPLLIAH
jgi:nucleotide-binding universal stress UspA family protein